jgi:predicted patatin/cPLA2 family phospholipase
VLSGGGDKGSYQASAFITFTQLIDKEDLAYDVVQGVSVGSLNGSGLASYAPGNETAAAEWIFGVWNDLRSSDVFTMWPGGIIEGIFEQQGIFNNTNLIHFFKNKLADKKILKKISVGAADMNTARYISYDYNETDLTDSYVDHVIASTAMPFAFPPLLENNRTLLDGGVIWKMDIPGAIRRCLEIVDDESDIIMDVIMTAESHVEELETLRRYTTLEHFIRGQEIKSFHKDMKILNNTVIAHPKVNFRYVLGPSVKLTISPIPLDFSKKHMEFCFEVGKKDATNAVKLGPKGYMNLMIEYSNKLKKGEIVSLDEMIQTRLAEIEGQKGDVSF